MTEEDKVRKLRFAHLSDTHLGYSAYHDKTAPNGMNIRYLDVIKAFRSAVRGIIEADPPLVIHTGDLAEKPTSWNDADLYMVMQTSLEELASIRPDGSRRQVILIAGNHDLPSRHSERCYIDTLSWIPGLHTVTDDLEVVDFSEISKADPTVPKELAHSVVTAIPHDTLKDLALNEGFDSVQPVSDRISILASHGVVGGSELYRRIGREYHLPSDVATREWQYVAMGHWHKRGPVRVSAGAPETVWYAGSTENIGFGDLADTPTKGWLEVELSTDRQEPSVGVHPVVHRKMMRLQTLDADGLTAQQLQDALIGRLQGADIDDAVAGQVIVNATPDTWRLVDLGVIRAHADAAGALHYQADPKWKKDDPSDPAGQTDADGSADATVRLDRLTALLTDRAKESIKDKKTRDGALGEASKTLRSAVLEAQEQARADAVAPAEEQEEDELPRTAAQKLAMLKGTTYATLGDQPDSRDDAQ